MRLFNTISASASALTAERLRMDLIAGNVANINTTRTPQGGPYRRKLAVFEPKDAGPTSFASLLRRRLSARTGLSAKTGGVRIGRIIEDPSPPKMRHAPDHPDADEDGYVAMPNIDLMREMVDLVGASRAYEANVNALNTTKNMMMQALQIGRM